MDDLKIKNENISFVCRACLSVDNLNSSLALHLHIIYEKITEIRIETNDKLPQNICTTCSNKLEDISKFIETCKLNDKYLNHLLEDNQVDEEDECFVENEALSDASKEDLLSEENEKEIVSTKNTLQGVFKKQSCETCGKSFSTCSALERHKKVHSGIKLFECKGCDKKFSQKSVLWRHFLTHTGDKPFECNLCGKQSKRKNQILDHILKQHPNVPQTEYNIVITRREVTLFDQATIPSVENKTEIEINEIKSDINSTKLELIDDQESKKPKPNQIEIVEENEEIEENDRPTKKKRLELCLCSLCGKQFKRNEYLRNHMATHMNVKPYTCSICGTGFTQRQALSRHNLVHTKERPHKCTHCEKTFTRKEKLTDHIRCHEEGVPPHLCFHCGRRFKDREYLRKHLHYHLKGGKNRWRPESKRCLCPDCGKEFHSESYLKKHLNIHTGEKPFTCEICNKSFSVSAGLDYHMKIHKGMKPFKCTHSQCNKAFRTKYALKIHEKMHGTERPFKCTVCSKGFVRNSHLKRHVKLHEDNSESQPVNT